MFIPVTNHLQSQRTIEVITAYCRQMLSQGRLDRFAVSVGSANVRRHLIWVVSALYSRISDAIEQFMVSPLPNYSYSLVYSNIDKVFADERDYPESYGSG